MGQKGQFFTHFGGTTSTLIFFLLFVQKTKNLCMDKKKSGGQRKAHNFLTPNRKLKYYYFDPPKNIGSDILKMPSIMKFSFNESFILQKLYLTYILNGLIYMFLFQHNIHKIMTPQSNYIFFQLCRNLSWFTQNWPRLMTLKAKILICPFLYHAKNVFPIITYVYWVNMKHDFEILRYLIFGVMTG